MGKRVVGLITSCVFAAVSLNADAATSVLYQLAFSPMRPPISDFSTPIQPSACPEASLDNVKWSISHENVVAVLYDRSALRTYDGWLSLMGAAFAISNHNIQCTSLIPSYDAWRDGSNKMMSTAVWNRLNSANANKRCLNATSLQNAIDTVTNRMLNDTYNQNSALALWNGPNHNGNPDTATPLRNGGQRIALMWNVVLTEYAKSLNGGVAKGGCYINVGDFPGNIKLKVTGYGPNDLMPAP
jgi:hypothetical protein